MFYKILTSLLLCVIFAIYTNAQTPFFTSLSLTSPELTVKETSNFNRISTNPYLTGNEIIEINDLSTSQNDGALEISFPNAPCGKMTFQVSEVNYINENQYEWYGELSSTEYIDTCFCKFGTFITLSTSTGKIGHLTIDDAIYEISDISDRYAVISKVETSLFPETECKEVEGFSMNNQHQNINTRENGNCDIRCLFLYTDKALELEGSINNLVNRAKLGITQSNLAFKNSGVFDCDARLEYAAIEPFGSEPQNNDIFIDLQNIRDSSQYFGLIDSLRDIHEADIAVIFTKEYNNAFGAGIIETFNRPYALVTVGTPSTSRFTLTHEIGHILGGRDFFWQPDDSYVYGHKFKTGKFLPCIFGKNQHTIMERIGSNDSRILHFSNPNVEFEGVKTGHEVDADMAREIKNNACTISQLRETIIPFSVSLSAEKYYCPCETSPINTTLYGGTAGATYTYEWYKSIDGINWDPLTQSASSINLILPCTADIKTFVKVIVQSSDGQEAESPPITVETAMTWPNQEFSCPFLQDPNDDDWENIVSLKIYPNPSFFHSNVSVHVKKAGIYTIHIKDINGQIIETLAKDKYFKIDTYLYSTSIVHKGLSFLEITNDIESPNITKIIRL